MPNNDYLAYLRDSNELYHYGIKGQKWGIRRYQNEDGSLTPEGQKRYGHLDSQEKINEAIKRDKIFFKEQKSFARGVKLQDTRSEKKVKRLGERYDKAKSKGNQKRADRLEKKLENARNSLKEGNAFIKWALKDIENTPVDQLKKERASRIGKNIATTAIMNLAGVSLAALTGFGFVGYSDRTRANDELDKYAKKLVSDTRKNG